MNFSFTTYYISIITEDGYLWDFNPINLEEIILYANILTKYSIKYRIIIYTYLDWNIYHETHF